LPLKKGERIAFIGGYAAAPRYQGGGSSHINSFKVTCALEAASGIENIVYSEGFSTTDDIENRGLFDEAVQAAQAAKAAVVFAGLPDSFESEGYDRTHMDLPSCQNKLISAIVKAQPNTVVVLHNGSPVSMPWAGEVKGILEMYLGGEAVGQATVDLLFGDVSPSGKLAETFPLRLEDTPCYLDFPGSEHHVCYSEGIYVGYRYYDTKNLPVLFPFGHGLSYTTFEIKDLQLSSQSMTDKDALNVLVNVKNTGSVKGKETVQLYVAPPKTAKTRRPTKELKGFEKVELDPGEEKTVRFTLGKRSFAYYEERIHDWFVESGDFTILLGSSSADLPLSASVHVTGTDQIPFEVSDILTCGDVWNHAADSSAMDKLINRTMFAGSSDAASLGGDTDRMMRMMLDGLPLHSLISFGDITLAELDEVLSLLRNRE
jgi:beta-glucosidase